MGETCKRQIFAGNSAVKGYAACADASAGGVKPAFRVAAGFLGSMSATVGHGEWWSSGKTGSLSPKAQAQVWGLKMAWEHFGKEVSFTEIASLVSKVGGGHPTKQAVHQLCAKMEEDEHWYPGKREAEAQKRGPKPGLTAQKKRAIAACAMALKKAGIEPSVAEVRKRCPKATQNAKTGEPLTDTPILDVFRNQCYDDGAAEP